MASNVDSSGIISVTDAVATISSRMADLQTKVKNASGKELSMGELLDIQMQMQSLTRLLSTVSEIMSAQHNASKEIISKYSR